MQNPALCVQLLSPCPGAVGGSRPDGIQTSRLQPTLPRPPLAFSIRSSTLMLSSANRRVHRGGLLRGWAEPSPALGPERVLEHGRSGFLLPSAGRAHLEAIT